MKKIQNQRRDKLRSLCRTATNLHFMRRLRVGIIGAGPLTEWTLAPVLQGPDAVAPPDEGAWWSRRPLAGSDIRWQAPTRPEIVALCDTDSERLQRIGAQTRVVAQYADWRAMLAETPLDAVFCENAADLDIDALLAAMSARNIRKLWLFGPPDVDFEWILHLSSQSAARGVLLWWAQPLRHAVAHRAARQLVKRGEIGDVTALSLRWSTPFVALAGAQRAESYGAMDLLMSCVGAAPVEVLASSAKGSTSLWLRFDGGATATAIFAAGDAWNSSLPRLEIIGTQGRFLVCEGGRRVGMFQPREAARWIEPPGLAAYVSAANISGVAEDIKLFLAAPNPGEELPPKPDSNMAEFCRDGREAARTMQLLEAAGESLKTGAPVAIAPMSSHPPKVVRVQNVGEKNPKNGFAAPLTLPLNL